MCDRISSVLLGRFGGLYAARELSRRTGPRDADRQAELSPFPPHALSGRYRIAFCGRNRGALRSIFSRQCNVDLLMTKSSHRLSEPSGSSEGSDLPYDF